MQTLLPGSQSVGPRVASAPHSRRRPTACAMSEAHRDRKPRALRDRAFLRTSLALQTRADRCWPAFARRLQRRRPNTVSRQAWQCKHRTSRWYSIEGSCERAVGCVADGNSRAHWTIQSTVEFHDVETCHSFAETAFVAVAPCRLTERDFLDSVVTGAEPSVSQRHRLIGFSNYDEVQT